MKKILLSSLVAAAAAVPAFAGVDNINYQAVIKNGNAVVADKTVALKFELLDKAENVVYSEVQDKITNANGYVACQLGEEGDLSTIEWGDLTLRVSVDLGSGYEVFSTEAVSSVPTALYALKSADSDMIIEAVENLMVDVESNRTSVLGINAELVKFDGYIEESEARFDNLGENLDNAFAQMTAQFEEVNGQLENLNNVAAVVRANEEAIETLQGDFKNLGENLDKSFEQMTAKFEEIDGQLENLNNVSAVVRVNEEAIADLQQSFENLGENLDKSFEQMTAQFQEVNGQLENLNNVSAVVRVNEEAIEMLTPEVERLVQANEETQSKLNSFGADIAQIEGLATDVEMLKEAVYNGILNGEEEDSLTARLAEQIGALYEQIEALKAEIASLKGE